MCSIDKVDVHAYLLMPSTASEAHGCFTLLKPQNDGTLKDIFFIRSKNIKVFLLQI